MDALVNGCNSEHNARALVLSEPIEKDKQKRQHAHTDGDSGANIVHSFATRVSEQLVFELFRNGGCKVGGGSGAVPPPCHVLHARLYTWSPSDGAG